MVIKLSQIAKEGVTIKDFEFQKLDYFEVLNYLNEVRKKQEALKKLKITDNKYLEMCVTI